MAKRCEECMRLWNSYGAITQQFLKVISDQQIAGLQHDHETLGLLDQRHKDVEELRAEARQALKVHQRLCLNPLVDTPF